MNNESVTDNTRKEGDSNQINKWIESIESRPMFIAQICLWLHYLSIRNSL